MRTIAVIALKGGSGKTTIATHLALAAHLRGVETMVADIDPQHSADDILHMRQSAGPSCMRSTGPKLMGAQFAAVGLKKDLLIIDTPAGIVEDVGEAIVLADFVVMVVRPTLLDLAGFARSFQMVRKLVKPCTVVVSQAPAPRENIEAPVVKRALKGLEFMRAPVAPVIVRNRAIYQTALETGRSAEEAGDPVAAREIAALWDFVSSEIADASEAA